MISTSSRDSDVSEVTGVQLGPDFPDGLFVAMSDNRTFQLYSWRDFIGSEMTTMKE